MKKLLFNLSPLFVLAALSTASPAQAHPEASSFAVAVMNGLSLNVERDPSEFERVSSALAADARFLRLIRPYLDQDPRFFSQSIETLLLDNKADLMPPLLEAIDARIGPPYAKLHVVLGFLDDLKNHWALFPTLASKEVQSIRSKFTEALVQEPPPVIRVNAEEGRRLSIWLSEETLLNAVSRSTEMSKILKAWHSEANLGTGELYRQLIRHFLNASIRAWPPNELYVKSLLSMPWKEEAQVSVFSHPKIRDFAKFISQSDEVSGNQATYDWIFSTLAPRAKAAYWFQIKQIDAETQTALFRYFERARLYPEFTGMTPTLARLQALDLFLRFLSAPESRDLPVRALWDAAMRLGASKSQKRHRIIDALSARVQATLDSKRDASLDVIGPEFGLVLLKDEEEIRHRRLGVRYLLERYLPALDQVQSFEDPFQEDAQPFLERAIELAYKSKIDALDEETAARLRAGFERTIVELPEKIPQIQDIGEKRIQVDLQHPFFRHFSDTLLAAIPEDRKSPAWTRLKSIEALRFHPTEERIESEIQKFAEIENLDADEWYGRQSARKEELLEDPALRKTIRQYLLWLSNAPERFVAHTAFESSFLRLLEWFDLRRYLSAKEISSVLFRFIRYSIRPDIEDPFTQRNLVKARMLINRQFSWITVQGLTEKERADWVAFMMNPYASVAPPAASPSSAGAESMPPALIGSKARAYYSYVDWQLNSAYSKFLRAYPQGSATQQALFTLLMERALLIFEAQKDESALVSFFRVVESMDAKPEALQRIAELCENRKLTLFLISAAPKLAERLIRQDGKNAAPGIMQFSNDGMILKSIEVSLQWYGQILQKWKSTTSESEPKPRKFPKWFTRMPNMASQTHETAAWIYPHALYRQHRLLETLLGQTSGAERMVTLKTAHQMLVDWTRNFFPERSSLQIDETVSRFRALWQEKLSMFLGRPIEPDWGDRCSDQLAP